MAYSSPFRLVDRRSFWRPDVAVGVTSAAWTKVQVTMVFKTKGKQKSRLFETLTFIESQQGEFVYAICFFRKTNLNLFSFTLQVAQLVYIPQTTIGMPAHIKHMPWKFHIRGICFTIFRKRTYPLGIKLSLHLAKEECRRRWYCQAAGCSKSGVTISSDTLMCRHITGYPQRICSQMTTFENTSRKRLITLIITVNKSQL